MSVLFDWMPGTYINMRVELLVCAPAPRCGMGLLVPLEAAGGIAFQESRARDRERRQGDAPQHTAPPTPPPAGTRDGGGRQQTESKIIIKSNTDTNYCTGDT